MKAAREAWFAGQLDLDPERLVFLDETAAATSMVRRYGETPATSRRPSVSVSAWRLRPVTRRAGS